jgi:hypothetical protein
MRNVIIFLFLQMATVGPGTAQVTSGSPWSEALTFGVLDGHRALTFGEITDLAVDAAGRIYVLDHHAREVRVFSPDGEPRQIVGRRGGGPGEFQEPSSVTVTADGLLIVTDRAHRRLTLYEISDSLVYHSDSRVDLSAREACRLGNDIFFLGFLNDALIHQFAVSRDAVRHVRSFGSPFSEEPMQRRYGEHIGCIEGAGLVVIATGNLPQVHAYSVATGNLAWKTELVNYSGIAITRLPEGGLMYGYPEGQAWFHWITGVFATDGGTIGVQVGTVYQADDSNEAREFSIRLLSPSGNEIGTQPAPFQIHWTSEDRRYGKRALLFPQVVVARRGPR